VGGNQEASTDLITILYIVMEIVLMTLMTFAEEWLYGGPGFLLQPSEHLNFTHDEIVS
jgi:hypothetical protein